MSARTKKQAVIERPLPVIVPPKLGPALIPAEWVNNGTTVRFSFTRGEVGVYELWNDHLGLPVMVRRNT
jgi:hypothetical protein